ncbi:MAG: ATP-dependent helicase C-terminal domain-containing protein, partial [Akkermansiaceae bacterium]|nr:ATP-dependent helicase C-terminal domain-containing protein [Akkermansiaceae bacterium]
RAFRLWSQSSHARRAEFESPEIERVDLAEAVLLLKASGIEDIASFRWLTPPPAEALQRAQHLLHDLGALDARGRINEEGRLMASLPLEPRFARLMLAGHEHGCVAEAAFIAAAVQAEALFPNKRGSQGRKNFTYEEDQSDFAAEWRGFEAAEGMQYDPRRCQQVDVMARAAREIAKAMPRLLSLAKRFGWQVEAVDFDAHHQAVGQAMLAAFSDQLAVRQSASTLACRLVGQRKGKLDEASSARQADAFVAAEVTEVGGREVTTHLRRATAIKLDWLKQQFPDDFQQVSSAVWDESHRRVVAREETRFRDLVIEARESEHEVNADAAAEVLAEKVIAGELVLKKWDHKVEQWIERLKTIAKAMPELEMPDWSEQDEQLAVAQICHGAVRYKQIKDADPWPVLREWLNPAQQSALESYCPTRIKLANGQGCKITYDPDKGPFISVKVAHLLGVWKTPTLCDGRVPILVHVLTPGQKPWQMTKDLESFWENGYPQMRKELAGRYPKHPWPEDPKSGC